jgi:hypothetical protein
VTLAAMNSWLPGWSLCGHEQEDRKLNHLLQLSQFYKLYSGSLSLVDRTFDLVTLIHSLEHFVDPNQALRLLHSIVGAGNLFIEVSNIIENPFDILVADHLLHLSPTTLRCLLENNGYMISTIATDWIAKELSVVATAGTQHLATFDGNVISGEACYQRIVNYVDWLSQLITVIKGLSFNKSVGIFGTSIAATWLASIEQERIAFFVDEDESRVGKTHLGRPILHPSQIPNGQSVFIALAPTVATNLARRLAYLPCQFVLPPALIDQ